MKKTLKSKTSSPTDGADFELAWKERMEQQDWTLLKACKACDKMFSAWRRIYQTHFLWEVYDKPNYATLPGKFHASESAFQSTNVIQFSF